MGIGMGRDGVGLSGMEGNVEELKGEEGTVRCEVYVSMSKNISATCY